MIRHKKLSLLALALAAAFLLTGFAFTASLAEDKPLLLSLEELAQYDGKDGRPAYAAVDGVIYDVTESPAWAQGAHKGQQAGLDLSEAFKNSPHDISTLDKVEKIGRLSVNLTLEQLKDYNGKDGKPAYVAVDGVIYDMTESLPWKDGKHNGNEAGNDLTKQIKEVSPHGVAKLANVVEIGRLVQELTLEQLSVFNGKDGQPAYVAVDGILYDVTNSSAWAGGAHAGLEAGQDLSEAFKTSPHDITTLDKVEKIGTLIQ